MMRNNRRLQSLGIPAIVGMMRSSGPEGSKLATDESAFAITQGEDSDYNPSADEVLEEEEVNGSVVETPVKVQDCTCLLFFFFIVCTQFITCDLILLYLLFIQGI